MHIKNNIVRSILNLYILKKYPFSVVHFITNRCNARCSHCFIDFSKKELFKNELSLAEIEKLTCGFGNYLFNVNLTGGEPFLREDIYEIAEAYFNNAGVKSVFITTNGMFTHRIKEFIDKFIRSKIKGNIIISVSLDNFEKLHDRSRAVSGLFSSALATYKLVKGYNLSRVVASVNITVSEHNHLNLVDFYKFLKKNDISNITVTPLREQGMIKKIDYRTKEKIYAAYCELSKLIYSDMIESNTAQKNIEVALQQAKNVIYYHVTKCNYLKPKFRIHCIAASLFSVISADGFVYPCEILDAALGNLRDYDMDIMRLLKANKSLETKRLIRGSKCNCVYGCAWTVNILSNLTFVPQLLYHFTRLILCRKIKFT